MPENGIFTKQNLSKRMRNTIIWDYGIQMHRLIPARQDKKDLSSNGFCRSEREKEKKAKR